MDDLNEHIDAEIALAAERQAQEIRRALLMARLWEAERAGILLTFRLKYLDRTPIIRSQRPGSVALTNAQIEELLD